MTNPPPRAVRETGDHIAGLSNMVEDARERKDS